jgi:hypothetical protein
MRLFPAAVFELVPPALPLCAWKLAEVNRFINGKIKQFLGSGIYRSLVSSLCALEKFLDQMNESLTSLFIA